MAIKRVNIRISEELDRYYTEESERMGVSKSSLMCISMEEYVAQKIAMKTLPELFQEYKIQKGAES